MDVGRRNTIMCQPQWYGSQDRPAAHCRKPREKPSMNNNELSPNEPVTIYTLNDPYEAEIIKNALRSEGIRCELHGEGQAGLAEIFPIVVVVRVRDADEARKIVQKHEERD